MNRKLTIILALILSLTGCVSAEERRKAEELKQQKITYAQKNFGKKQENDCIEAFKGIAHDPASLQIAGKFYYDDEGTQIVSWPRMKAVTFAAPIRAKNAMGGLVKKRLQCRYAVDPSTSMFVLIDVTSL